jgi:branched-chain amino acid transport system substrate-binding protein
MKKSVLLGIVVVVVVVAAAAAFLLGMQQAAPESGPAPEQKVIKVGAICDMTGPVSDQGKPYCLGIFDAIEWFEKNYPLPKGYKVELTWVDYSYKIPEAQAAYDRFKAMGVKFLFLTGTGETAALAPKLTEDKIPALSASYAAELAKKEAQYYFFGQTDYSTHGRAMVMFVVEKWKEMHGGNPPRPPRLGLAYPNVPYGTAPIPAIKDMAKQLGVELCPDQIVDLAATDATAQMLKFKECGADFIWTGGTAASTIVIMRDAKKVGLNAIVITNTWGTNEAYMRANPDVSEGNYVVTSTVPYYPDIENGNTPGAKIIREFAKAKGRSPYSDLNMAYVRGWVHVNIMYKALRDVINNGWEITGENIWKALVNIKDWDFSPLTGIVADKYTYTPEDRRPHMTVWFYKITTKDGELRLELERVIKLERKPEWLGW